jgi:hypothetical protein
MKYYTFKRESNDFSDFLKDANVKKYISTKIRWRNHLMVGISDKATDGVLGYIVLKYGDEMVNPITKDYSPIPNVDYIPKRK